MINSIFVYKSSDFLSLSQSVCYFEEMSLASEKPLACSTPIPHHCCWPVSSPMYLCTYVLLCIFFRLCQKRTHCPQSTRFALFYFRRPQSLSPSLPLQWMFQKVFELSDGPQHRPTKCLSPAAQMELLNHVTRILDNLRDLMALGGTVVQRDMLFAIHQVQRGECASDDSSVIKTSLSLSLHKTHTLTDEFELPVGMD